METCGGNGHTHDQQPQLWNVDYNSVSITLHKQKTSVRSGKNCLLELAKLSDSHPLSEARTTVWVCVTETVLLAKKS